MRPRENRTERSAANNSRDPEALGTALDGTDGPFDPAHGDGYVRWLSEKPEVVIPHDFAVRVQQYVFAQPKLRRPRLPGWGARLMVASAGVLMVAKFALAPHAVPSLTNAAFDGELMSLAELGGVLLFSSYLLVRE